MHVPLADLSLPRLACSGLSFDLNRAVGALPNGQGHRRAADQRVARGHPEEPGVPVSPLNYNHFIIIIIITIHLLISLFFLVNGR